MTIRIERGRILIPMEMVQSRKFTRPFKQIMPGAQWGGPKTGCFWVHVSNNAIAKVQKLFGVDLSTKIPIKKLVPIDPSQFKTLCRDHQIKALQHGIYEKFYGYFLEPGLGKSKILIDNSTALYYKDHLDTVVVLCPKAVMVAWLEELEVHGWMDRYHLVYWDTKPIWVRRSGRCDLRWLLINPEALTSGLQTEKVYNRGYIKKVIVGSRQDAKGYDFLEKIMVSSGRCMMAVDESTMLSGYDSYRTQQAMELRKYAEYRRILTGTPFANDLIDAYPQMKWLSPECVGQRSYFAWKKEYAILGGFKGKKIIGYRKRDEIKAMIHTFGFRVRTRDVLNLTEPIYQKRWVEWGPDAKKIYNQAVEELILKLDNGDLDLARDGVLFTKLWQICGGTVKDNEGKAQTVHKHKIDSVKAVLSEIDCDSQQVIIWCHFKAEIELLKKELSGNYRVGVFKGGMPVAKQAKVKSDFNSGTTNILIAQDDAAHMGLTINAATYGMFYSNHNRPIVREQAERRNWRDGKEGATIYIDFLTKGLRDEQIYENQMDKIDSNTKTINATPDELRRILNYAS